MTSAYIDERHKYLARKFEDAKLTERTIRRLITVEVTTILPAVFASVSSGYFASTGWTYLPAAIGWGFGLLAFCIVIGFCFTIGWAIGDHKQDTVWQNRREAERDLDDYLEDKVTN